MNMMNDQQVRRFINNLCNYTEGKEVELPTELEKALWIGVLPSLKINDEKYERVLERNRKNGQMGGAPLGNQNARKEETTQNNPNNPISDKCKVINDKREVITGNSKETSDKREVVTGNSEMETGNWKVTIVENENLGMILKDAVIKEAPVDEAYNYKRMHIYNNVKYNGKKLSRNEFNALSEADQKDYRLFLMDLDPKGKTSEDRIILGW